LVPEPEGVVASFPGAPAARLYLAQPSAGAQWGHSRHSSSVGLQTNGLPSSVTMTREAADMMLILGNAKLIVEKMTEQSTIAAMRTMPPLQTRSQPTISMYETTARKVSSLAKLTLYAAGCA